MRHGVNPDSIPRYREPTGQEPRHCGDCCYCKGVQGQAYCVFEVFQADTFDQLEEAELRMVADFFPVCRDFKELA